MARHGYPYAQSILRSDRTDLLLLADGVIPGVHLVRILLFELISSRCVRRLLLSHIGGTTRFSLSRAVFLKELARHTGRDVALVTGYRRNMPEGL